MKKKKEFIEIKNHLALPHYLQACFRNVSAILLFTDLAVINTASTPQPGIFYLNLTIS